MYLPTLNRVLCSSRVTQMTKTYDDIEAVTRLLEEKEKDIELTARIGKELLSHNAKLENTIATLETELRHCQDKITQLSHELLKKNELLQILTNDIDEPGSEAGTPTGVRSVPFELLQKRINNLEEENGQLRCEASRLAEATESCEEAEAKLVNDLVGQLEYVRLDLAAAGLEGERLKTREVELKELVDHLQAKLQATDDRLAQALKENEEYITLINISRETQCELATELGDLKERFSETQSILQELQNNARKASKQNKSMVRAGPLYPYLHTTQAPTRNSIAAELECSLFSELSLDSGLGASTAYIPNYKKVFETVRSASRSNSVCSSEGVSVNETPGGIPAPRLGGTLTTGSTTYIAGQLRPRTSTMIGHAFESPPSFTDLDDITPTSSDCGGGDVASTTEEQLEAALKRLTPAAVDARRAAFSDSMYGLHHDCPTPDSIMSAGTNVSYSTWKLPDKLQIVKPLEGSATLHHWSELATPSLEGLLDERPGVKIRGGTELEHLGIQMYSLSDIEEDEEIHPGKSFSDTNHIYTFTNSTVLHPDDNTSVTPSVRGSQMSSVVSSRMSSACSTPRTRSRRNSTSTVSTTPSLARLLAERGIKAVTPSALGTPAYSPTATPCNSPDRPSSPVQEDEDQHSALGLPGFLMSSGAELIWKTLGNALKSSSSSRPKALLRPDNKAALSGIRLVERIERIGLEEILTPSSCGPRGSGIGGGSGGAVGGGGGGASGGQLEPGSPRTLHRAELRRTVRSQESGPGVLGVPGRPGTNSLENRLAHLPPTSPSAASGGGSNGKSSSTAAASGATSTPRSVRPDLGSVPSPPGLASNQRTHDSLGTLSAIFFGRKGGLL
ncbi:trafficking kinesin-binding protein milt isoform X5 [Rhodnius prolixus]|uniref:trafficking kinesin-binding protein milt isoform X5 n=1 Tax=Rhodnius prolixus TaxID=13249 RepID=UPI003D18D162